MGSATLRHSLADLRADESYFGELRKQAQSDEVKGRVERHLQGIRQRASTLEAFVKHIQDSVEMIDSTDSLRKCQRELNQKLAHFQGTDEGEVLDPLVEQLVDLEGALRKLEQLEHEPVEAPEQADRLLAELSELEGKMPYEVQRRLCVDGRAALKERVQGAVNHATAWYKSKRREFDAHEYSQSLYDSLTNPPAFLPETHCPELVAMRTRVREELDNDEVEQLVSAFQRIQSVEKRRECLGRLNALLN